ncbi:uncharacterized GPI-anchored protein at5g19240 [Phtheirospermum japonicum]|uniref:Uncharacterized GPI-anchored protein at5g19240 n=1 Tax=Phtheirospermum japonicum TaxID=374723 RepID=A0A830C6E6_9LAMI|nr:uncharacterized GPI-anchored protein at5g19240 [Phtheirospermum japonicum]
MNNFRQSSNAPHLIKHDKADCVADRIADQLYDQHCTSNTVPPTQSRLVSNYPTFKGNSRGVNTTRDRIILPICAPLRRDSIVEKLHTVMKITVSE